MRVGVDLQWALLRGINRLNDIGGALSDAVRRIRRRWAAGMAKDAATDAAPRAEDVEQAWELVGQTIRWARVLVRRFCADAEADKAELEKLVAAELARTEPAEPVAAKPAGKQPVRAKPRGPRGPDLDRAIRRKTVAEIVEQICADLGAAATLLGETEAAQDIAAIAAEMRALLDDAGYGVGAAVSRPGPGVRPAGAGPAAMPAAAGPLRAPDSG
jgi:hypothetical protein